MKEETIKTFCKGCKMKSLKYNKEDKVMLPFCLEADEFHRFLYKCPFTKS